MYIYSYSVCVHHTIQKPERDQSSISGELIRSSIDAAASLLTLSFLLTPVEGLHDAIRSVMIVSEARHAEMAVGALLRREAIEVGGAGDVDAGGRRAILIRLRVVLAREGEAQPVVGGSHLGRPGRAVVIEH